MEYLNYQFVVRYVQRPDRIECIVEYPDFKGIIGSGDTIEQAIADARASLSTYLNYLQENNQPLPNPVLLQAQEEFSGKLSLRISKSLHRKVAERAKKEEVSINQVLNEAISSYVYGKTALDIYKDCFENLVSEKKETKTALKQEKKVSSKNKPFVPSPNY